MTLINIEYGSLASSDTMNKNFSYLQKKIEESSDSTMTSISSILSNIATINSRLNELSELILDNKSEFNSKIDEYKNKTKILVQQTTLLPHWNACRSISINSTYTVLANGFLIVIPNEDTDGELKINSTIIEGLNQGIIILPVKENDIITSTISIKNSFFLPVAEINIENF